MADTMADQRDTTIPATSCLSPPTAEQELARAAHLLDAQTKAAALFDEIERDLVRPGVSEAELSRAIHELAARRHGVHTHWHKRVVRSGPHTLLPYSEDPADRTIGADDILFVDLGPVFAAWEADFGRTFVLGNDPVKHRLRHSLAIAWAAVKARFDAAPDVTGAQLYAAACDEARALGWHFGGVHCGHLLGEFPHERIPKDMVSLYITDGNHKPMRRPDGQGRKRHWVLEMHLVDRDRQIGAFMEQLLTVDPATVRDCSSS